MAALATLVVLTAPAAAAQPPSITPRPLIGEPAAGKPLVIGAGAPILAPAGDAKAQWIAGYLQNLILKTRGMKLPVAATGRRASAAIHLERGGDEGPDGYQLDVGPGGARIRASSDAGLFYGAVSLWQLMTAEPGSGPAAIGPVHVVDRPRFAYRGVLLDSARHFQSAAFVERMIDWMALHKLNVLQWHLTDDQGWRIQIRRYPRLTSVGAWRAPHDSKMGRPLRYGGFYTQSQIRRIVAYAARRQVTIIPEIEMPGHSLSAILAYPKLGTMPADAKTQSEKTQSEKTQSDWGVFPDILAPSEPTYAFMTEVLTEVMALFPSPWINIGGDEAAKDEWKASPTVQAQIKALGLPTEDALQGWFTARIARFLAAHGRRAIGWDDILVGGEALPADAATVSWHLEGVLKAAHAGHDTVIALAPTYYLDNRQADLASEPTGRGWLSRLAEVYALDPTPATMTAPDAARVIGVQANLWTEHMPDEATVAKLAFPRAAALAETGWTAPGRKDWSDFVGRLPAELARYHALGLDPDTGAVGVKLERQRGPNGALAAVLSSQLGEV
ncbi:MAG TPA: beta-N-acetylhexosaminidase, partial [Caulobacteraceae bacterium]|nr:beta-N-acetylhexosaminidase [Caulobacteraceae bacterium]